MPIIQKKQKPITPARTIAFSFFCVILTGAFLLMLPISSKNGMMIPFNHALFTATSATCVTGLVIYDTFQQFTIFGQLVILAMIQIGGLGLVTFITFFNFAIGKKLGLRKMQVASESVSADGFNDARGLVKNIIKFSLAVESIGAAILMLAFVPKYGLSGIFTSIFISVSAFCNAGFDILGINTAFSSVTEFNSNPIVLFTTMALIVFGGLGFIVWYDLKNYKIRRHLELHTKIVLIVTAILILTGTIAFLFCEWNNNSTIGNMSLWDKIMNCAFQSVTCRTAGFNSIDIISLHPVSKVVSIILMYIGAAPGSTGGGIKVTTIAVIIMTVVSILKNKEETTILGRKLDKSVVYKSLTIAMLSMALIFVTSIAIYFSLNAKAANTVSGLDTLFESVSAFATVGLSVGVSGIANLFSEMLLVFLMFLGRVGPISVILSLTILGADKSKKQVFPEGKVMVG